MNHLQLTDIVGAVVAKDYRNTEVFKKIGIDFWCGGNKSLKDASKEAGVTTEQINTAVEQIAALKETLSNKFNNWEPGYLIDYIINTHHQFAKENAIVIYDLGQKVMYQHCENHPELAKLVTSLFLFLHDLLNQMKREEQVLFPKIRELEKGKYNQFNFAKNPVKELQKEYQAVGKDLKLVRKITNDYLLPDDAGNSYKYLFKKLKEFENDLFLHFYLENEILFPKVVSKNVGLN